MAARGLLLLALTSFVAFSAGSKILFSSTPSVIQDSLTQDLTMRCSLNDTADVFTGGLVGRDVTETANNMAHVTSVIVMRNSGEHVASITNYDPAKALVDPGMLMVNGDVSGIGNAGELGFIELTWQYPSVNQSGEYVCEINAIDDAGHNIVFSTSLEVGVTQPTVNELIKRIHDLEAQKNVTQMKVSNITSELTNLASVVSNCMQPKHYETGSVMCGEMDSPVPNNHDGGEITNIKHTAFKTPYAKPPVVKLGLRFLDHELGGNIRFELDLVSVDEFGFSVRCHTWSGTHLFNLGVNWMSLPSE